jgi:hypothetical protein
MWIDFRTRIMLFLMGDVEGAGGESGDGATDPNKLFSTSDAGTEGTTTMPQQQQQPLEHA